MNLNSLANVIRKNIKHNAPAYLTAGACIGVVATAYLAAKNHLKAKEALDQWEELNGVSDNPRERIIERIGVTWSYYIPATSVGLFTIGCIVGANRIGNNQKMAAIATGAIAQRTFDEYKEKVIEQLGPKKHQEIMGKVAEKRLEENPPPGKDVVIAGAGHVLCCELYTGRYFMSDVESLRKAQNTLNQKVLAHDYATLADFQYMIGLTPTSSSTDAGWTSSRLMELEISAILTHDDRPCLAFDYNYTVPV